MNVQLDERGMMASDFVLREGGRRSGSLFGKNEFLQAKRYFEQRNGPGSVKGAYGKWGSGDNLDTFNARYKIATDKGLPHDEAMIEAARKTKTGEWARAAGFNKVNITKAEGPPGAFTNVEVEFTTEVQPAAPALGCAHRHRTTCRIPVHSAAERWSRVDSCHADAARPSDLIFVEFYYRGGCFERYGDKARSSASGHGGKRSAWW